MNGTRLPIGGWKPAAISCGRRRRSAPAGSESGGLRVADRAIMPKIELNNINAPAITIGEDKSDLILEDARAGMFARSA
ncbi:hypothetical protein [uncultured Jannaschia sp.]|uniref:hypothetical protein n=1 Tax=uncultured Jannaschia sp. TaxID=293347 RepID=UPI0026357898|nr:hypothetical protein [uncultured Jannaschia sp.]